MDSALGNIGVLCKQGYGQRTALSLFIGPTAKRNPDLLSADVGFSMPADNGAGNLEPRAWELHSSIASQDNPDKLRVAVKSKVMKQGIGNLDKLTPRVHVTP
jgi:hypothetical protein